MVDVGAGLGLFHVYVCLSWGSDNLWEHPFIHISCTLMHSTFAKSFSSLTLANIALVVKSSRKKTDILPTHHKVYIRM